MKASEANFLNFLRQPTQLTIPIYQRTYSWTETQCRKLWDDILRVGTDEKISSHFIGSIVYITEGIYQVTHPSVQVIDGQQRLTTVMLILEALARHVGDSEPTDGFSAEKIRGFYLQRPLEKGPLGYKLLLTQTDKQTLMALIDQKPLPSSPSARIKENFNFFESRIAKLGYNLTPLCKGLQKLVLVDISLDRQQDNPQLIFESMNSTGLELSQADLIRNFVLMDMEPDHQKKLYADHWQPMEQDFGQEAYDKRFDGFMRHYLTLKTGNIPKVKQVYEEFKSYAQQKWDGDLESLVADIHKFAGHYCSVALGKEKDGYLRKAFRDLFRLRVEVTCPFLLQLYDDYSEGGLVRDDLIFAIRLVESYVFRRAVCSIPTNSLNNTFAKFYSHVDESQYLESVQAHFLQLQSYRRFPNDEEFQRELKSRDLYRFAYGSYWLGRIENHDRKEPVAVDEYTIEHVLPQNQSMPEHWQRSLGGGWERIRSKYLHTLGNLTLTGYNAEYSDHAFSQKRDMEGGFRESPLRVNRDLGKATVWNETAIQKRANRLASEALKVWQFPHTAASHSSTNGLQADKLGLESTNAASSFLEGEHFPGELFEVFDKQVLALDPCVSVVKVGDRKFVYRAEENLVVVTVKEENLSLSLNLEYRKIHDVDESVSDLASVQESLFGDVEIVLTHPVGISYVVSLVRKALEDQLGDSSE